MVCVLAGVVVKRTSIKIRRQHIKKKRDSQAATQYNSNHAFLPFICAFLVAFRWEAAPKPARGSLDSMRKKIRVPKILAPEDDLRLARARDLSIFCLSHRRLSSVFFPLSPPLLAIWSVHILARSPELYTRDALSISSPPLIRRASRQMRLVYLTRISHTGFCGFFRAMFNMSCIPPSDSNALSLLLSVMIRWPF